MRSVAKNLSAWKRGGREKAAESEILKTANTRFP